jgi:transcriptional regulator with XRE-family HTH domain
MTTDANPPDLLQDLPRAVREARIRLDLTQAALARQLGVSLPTVRRWEAGTATPTSAPVQARLRGVLEASAPVRQVQDEVKQAFEENLKWRNRLARSRGSSKGAEGIVKEMLADVEAPDAAVRLEKELKDVVRQVGAGLMALMAEEFAKTPLAGLPRRLAARLEQDMSRPLVLMMVASLREVLHEELAGLKGKKTRPSKKLARRRPERTEWPSKRRLAAPSRRGGNAEAR